MSTKILVLISAVLILILAVICIFVPMFRQQPTNIKYSQFPATEVLLNDLPTTIAGPSYIESINWSAPDKLIVKSIYIDKSYIIDEESHPLATVDIPSGKISPLIIKEQIIFGSSPTMSPDGKYLAIDRDTGFIRIIPIEEAYADDIWLKYTASSLAWSHDSNYLAFTNGGEIYIYDLQKEQMKMEFDPSLPNLRHSLCCSLAWSADDQKIAVALRGKKNSTDEWSDIYVLNLKNEQFVQVTNTPDESEGFPVWFPKEDILMFVSPSVEGEFVLARSDGLCQMKISELQGISSPVWSPDGTKLAFADLDKVYYVDASALENQINSFREKCNVIK